MNEIKNIELIIQPYHNTEYVIQEICRQAEVDCDSPYIFSAILIGDKLKINHIAASPIKKDCNVYTIRNVITDLLERAKYEEIVYTQPPLEQWLLLFRPLLLTMVDRASRDYTLDTDEALQLLYITVWDLYSKGYYLHNNLIFKSFINTLCQNYRKESKVETLKLDRLVNPDVGDLTFLDLVEDESYEEQAITQAKEKRLLALKELMLEDMSELQFDRILIQLKSRTVDRRTSYLLDKYRQMLNSTYIPRPGRRS